MNMPRRCPLCNQNLPEALSQAKLETRLNRLASPALAAERRKLKDEYEAHLAAHQARAKKDAEQQVARKLRSAEEKVRQSEEARRRAERKVNQKLLLAQKRVKAAVRRRDAEIRQLRIESQAAIKREVGRAVRASSQENDEKLKRMHAERDKDRLHHQLDRASLQRKVDDLSRKLDGQSGQQRGDGAEIDLFAVLRHAFCPNDKIDRIGRGVRGADIVHEVMDGGKTVGRIIYESKDTGGWNKSYITQAKKYRTQYETPHVVIVSRAFPPKEKNFCVFKGIAIIEKQMSIALATLMREGIIEIARLRMSGRSRDAKSQELYDYIVGPKFATRFREIAESLASLREQQQKERTWHERIWEDESRIHERIEGSHRKVEAQIRAIVHGGANGKFPVRGVKQDEWSNQMARINA
jgi:hypothetical protein